MNRRMKKWRAGTSVVGMLALAASMGIGMVGMSTSAGASARPREAASVMRVRNTTHNWHNNLAEATSG